VEDHFAVHVQPAVPLFTVLGEHAKPIIFKLEQS